MQMLRAGGASLVTDSVREPDIHNPRGYHELERVKDVDKGGSKSWLKTHKGSVVKVVAPLLKDLPLNLNYRVVFVRRAMSEILASQRKMLKDRGQPEGNVTDSDMASIYENHLRQTEYYLEHTPNFETLFLNYHDVIERSAGLSRAVCDFLGLPLDVHAMAAVVDPTLYRNRSTARETDRK